MLVFALVSVAGQCLLIFGLAGYRGGRPGVALALFTGLFGLTQLFYVLPMILVALVADRPRQALVWLICAGVVFLLNGIFCMGAASP